MHGTGDHESMAPSSERPDREADALRRSDERLRLALAAGRVGIWEWEIATDRVFWSPESYGIVGLSEEEFDGTREAFFDLVHPDDRQRLGERVAETLRGDGDFAYEFRIRRPSGETRWIVNRARVERDPSGAPRRLVGTVRDVTESKAAAQALREREEALREKQERLEAALAASGTGTFRWDIRTGVLSWDENLDRLFGLPPGRTARTLDAFLALVNPVDRTAVAEQCARCAKDGVDFALEFRVRWPDGSVHWLDDRGKTFRDADGCPAYMTGACVDVTDRKQRDLELRDSEARFRDLADAMPQIVWAATADGRVDYYNRRWFEITGADQAATGDGSWLPIVHPDDRERVLDAWRRSVAAGAPNEIECRLRVGRPPEYRWYLVRAVPVRDDAGSVVRWYGTSTDVHDLKAAEEVLKEGDRRKNEFLTFLGHELRNPLSAIVTALELIGRGSDVAQNGRLADVCRRQSRHLVRLVDDLLDVSRITRGQIELELRPADMASIVRSTVQDMRGILETRGIGLSVEVPPGGASTSVDATRIAQSLSNVLHNAAKNTPRGGHVAVRLERVQSGGRLCDVISVRDTGRGIPPGMLERIFEPFVQVDDHADRAHGGLGVGLALVRSLVELHGGSIVARSGGPGTGAEFVIRVPVTEPVPARLVPTRRRPAAPVAERRRVVVVVEDDQDLRDATAQGLESLGHVVEVASSGDEGLAKILAVRPDAAIVDVGLPGIDGFEVARRVRAVYGPDATLLVALTGYGAAEVRERALAAGFERCLVKPATIADLAVALNADGGA